MSASQDSLRSGHSGSSSKSNENGTKKRSNVELQKPWSALEVAKTLTIMGTGTGVGIATVTITTIVASTFMFMLILVFLFFVLRNMIVGGTQRLFAKTKRTTSTNARSSISRVKNDTLNDGVIIPTESTSNARNNQS
eukprot:CFRG5333T1